MVTRLEAMRVEITGHWGEDYGLSKEEALELLSVAEAAAQIGAAWRAIQNHFNDIEIPMNVLWAAYYDAIDRTEAAIAPLLEEAQ